MSRAKAAAARSFGRQESVVQKGHLALTYMRLSEVKLWEGNPKEHDLGALQEAIRRYGFRDAPIHDETLGAIVAGNGRVEALRLMREAGESAPVGVAIDGEGEWLIPVQMGIDAPSAGEAQAFGVDHNNLSAAGGTGGVDAMLAMWSPSGLAALYEELTKSATLPLTVASEQISEVADWTEPASPSEPMLAGRGGIQVRPVLLLPEVEVLERALAATGLANRGEALIKVCEGYLARCP